MTCKPRKGLKPCLTFYPTYDWELAFHIYIERESSLQKARPQNSPVMHCQLRYSQASSATSKWLVCKMLVDFLFYSYFFVEQGEAEVVLTPVRRSTRKSLSSQPHIVSTPKQQQDFELRLTPTTDEEPGCAEGGANELKESGVDLKDGNEEIEQEAVSIDAISESADIPVDTTSAEFSSKNFEPAQTYSVDTQHSTGGPSPTGVSTTAVVPTGILTNPYVLLSTSQEEQGINVSVKSSGRKRRCTRSSRVMFTCSPEELAGTQSKRSCRSTPSRRRIPTPFSDKTRRMNDNVSSSSDVTETSSDSERTEHEDKKTPRRMSSNKKMTKRQSCSKKHDISEIEVNFTA